MIYNVYLSISVNSARPTIAHKITNLVLVVELRRLMIAADKRGVRSVVLMLSVFFFKKKSLSAKQKGAFCYQQ